MARPSPTGRSERSVMEREPRPMPTMPDCTSSLIPNGSSTRTSASSLSLFPVASTVTASGPTSTTLARKTLIVWSTCVRASASARTLIRISSRCTEAAGSSSTIFSTFTSLFSCLVTCSSGFSAQLTTIVIREISACSVGPTARASMLKPRRANSPAIRTSTPGLFSTSTDSVWVVMFGSCSRCARSLYTNKVRRQVPRELDIVVARAGRDHRPHHRVVVDDEVDDDRPVIGLGGGLDHVVHVLGPLAAQSRAAVGLRELAEVGNPRPAGAKIGARVALVVEQRLPLPHHAKVPVVDHGDLDGDPLERAGRQLLIGHLEAAVAVDGPHLRVRAPHLRAHRGRHRVAPRAEPARVEPGVRVLVGDELRGPHLVLPDTRQEHRVRPRELPDALDHVLRGERAVARLLVAKRIGPPQLVELCPPRFVVALPARRTLARDRRDQVGDH